MALDAVAFAVGWLTIAVLFTKILHSAIIHLLPSRLGKYAHVSKNGDEPWALVTGASDGIGREMTQQLAKQGFNVVLHGRNHEKLSRVMSQLRHDHPDRKFRVLVADASRVPCMACLLHHQEESELHVKADETRAASAIDFRSIGESLRDLHLTMLINNAGGSLPVPQFLPLSESSEARITSNVSLNALFPLHLTRELLPLLVRNGPALVMNISSISDEGFPLLASYSASKKFLMNLTRTVGLEMNLDGNRGQVETLGVRVGRVTGVSGYKEKTSLFCPDARTMARAALNRAGWQHGSVVGYWAHALQGAGISMLPAWLQDKVVMAAMGQERARSQIEQSDTKLA